MADRTRFSWREAAAALAALVARVRRSDAEMTRFLNAVFGRDGWFYDPDQDLWMAPDPAYEGLGKSYYCIQRDGRWFKETVR